MSKVTKLLKSPGPFVRDALMKRYPIDIKQRIPERRFDTAKSNIDKWDSLEERLMINEGFDLALPIDFVFTYVDQRDPVFLENYQRHRPNDSIRSDVADPARFTSHDELRFALRSVEAYAPWVRRVHIVSDGQIPDWLMRDHPKIHIVNHSDIIEAQYLPTFNSHVIESCLHRIDGISEHFVYFNDDMMLSRPVSPRYFFTGTGQPFIFLSTVTLPNSPVNDYYDTPTEWGGKNARAMIFGTYGVSVSNMLAHTHYTQLTSIASLCESRWADAFHIMRQNRFRAHSDVLATGFLFPHVAALEGRGIYTRSRLSYFNVRHRGALKHYHWLISVRGTPRAPFSICPNDRQSEDGADFEGFEEALGDFMSAYFPDPSAFERRI